MKRRTFLQAGITAVIAAPLFAALRKERLDEAASVLERAIDSGQVAAAVLHVTQREASFTRSFGKATDENAMFLLGSISKPISVAALMTLYDQGEFHLDDRLQKFIPAFKGEGREHITIQHLLTHVSGLPDQLPENNELRRQHATLAEFAEHTIHTPLLFAPGSQYQYSSMGILLAARVAEHISGEEIKSLVDRAVLQPLMMKHSALGLGRFMLDDMVACQMEGAAPESGGGDPSAKDWDWNSSYWRTLGAPWGGVHASAPDIEKFLAELSYEKGAIYKPETARLIVSNHNPQGLTPRGLGVNVGRAAGSPGCSDRTFGHSGSTGTICWADPESQTICVVLTSLPARAAKPHPCNQAAENVAAAMK